MALQEDMEARLLARKGEMQEALARAKNAYELWTIHTENIASHHPEPHIRFHLAQLFRETEQPDSARFLFQSLVPPTSFFGDLTVLAWIELAGLSLESGNPSEARQLLARVQRLLGDAGPGIDHVLQRVRDIEARLPVG
jgi:ATP/maltotriose-dependent transcriptional regulator MalT